MLARERSGKRRGKMASPKSGITKIGHDLYPPMCVCMCAPLLFGNEGLVDHRVTHTKRFLPEDM